MERNYKETFQVKKIMVILVDWFGTDFERE